MVCENCGKKQATVHLTEIINGKMSELHLCDTCAQEKGASMKQHFSLADLLAGLTDVGMAGATSQETPVCPNCGLSYADFKKVGRLGCSECYEAFRESLAPLLKRIHGSTRHVGRMPERSGKTTEKGNQFQDLAKRLEHAIATEEYEEAARLRDEMRKMETAERRVKDRPKKEEA
ncbi:MAG: UvrB/UvrC motif-containing protein [Candidatus Omnitrophica bacterium]|nr:UvrB/UvrC motif-containing protein [Candidatus Omnitrophota bacterium]